MNKSYDKNRLKRLGVLDRLLSDSKKEFTMKQLTDEVSAEMGFPVDRYTVMRDLKFLEESLGIEIDKKPQSVENKLCNRAYSTYRYHYKDPEHSLFRVDLTDEERDFLGKALDLLGLKGISDTKMFRALKLKTGSENQIISFTKNPLEKSIGTIMSNLINCIKNKNVISFGLRDRKAPYNVARQHVHPWYLREYNRRWYLFGFDVKEAKIKRYAVDRIKPPVRTLGRKEYVEPSESMDEILKDVIGVSIPDSETLDVVFWVSEESADHVSRKPIHESQTEVGPQERLLLGNIPETGGNGRIFKIFCKNNYELRREMISFGPELTVLSPDSLRQELKAMLEKMCENYS